MLSAEAARQASQACVRTTLQPLVSRLKTTAETERDNGAPALTFPDCISQRLEEKVMTLVLASPHTDNTNITSLV